MTGIEAAVFGSLTGTQSVATGVLNTVTPTRGETVIANQTAVAEKPSDLPGVWEASTMPVTGVAKLRFYKRRSALVTPNVLKTVERSAERVKDKASISISGIKEKMASKPNKGGFLNLDKSEKAKEKHEALKEKVQQKKYKTRCLIPIDVHYTLQECEGLPPQLAKQEKEDQEAYAKAKEDYDKTVVMGNPFALQEPQKPKKLDRVATVLFANARADIGSGLVNSLGETLKLTVSLTPKWEGQGRRSLYIGWKVVGLGMKASRGFEHSGVAIAIVKLQKGYDSYGEAIAQPGLEPASRQDKETTYRFLPGYGAAEMAGTGEDSSQEDPVREKAERKSKSKEDDDDLPVMSDDDNSDEV